jgi:hypothetical protein
VLECVAHDNPQPLITWQRKDGTQDTGNEVLEFVAHNPQPLVAWEGKVWSSDTGKEMLECVAQGNP